MNIITRECIKKSGYYCNCKGDHCDLYCCPMPPIAPTGWICPKCGRGNAPYNETCSCVTIENSDPNRNGLQNYEAETSTMTTETKESSGIIASEGLQSPQYEVKI